MIVVKLKALKESTVQQRGWQGSKTLRSIQMSDTIISFTKFLHQQINYKMQRTLSHPKIVQCPGLSMLETAFAAVSDHGRWAPTRAQAIPSRIRCLARSATSIGISEEVRV